MRYTDTNMQMDIFTMLKMQEESKKPIPKRLNVGDYIGRLVLGEVEKARITEIVGNEQHFFYRTDMGSCFYSDDRTDFDEMEREAIEIRKQYKTIEIEDFDRFFAVAYPPRASDQRILCAMVGIYDGMLFWKEECTYQFLEPVKNIEKAYKDKVFALTHYGNKEEREYTQLKQPIPVKRLYWSNKGFYTDAKYVKFNG